MKPKSIYSQFVFGALFLSLALADPVLAAYGNKEHKSGQISFMEPNPQISSEVKPAVGQYENIQVRILDHGKVLLTGTVTTDAEMDDAVRRAGNIPGVAMWKMKLKFPAPKAAT